ncbi:MAG: methyltransferase domain-containing protein [Planctomycetes bacterium]|nr:methyltransferase domain-containing protein [Planctomycetota bacterium]
MHDNSRLLFLRHCLPRLQPGHRVLEIGPDGTPSSYARLTGLPGITWDTLDLEARPGLTHVARGENEFPVGDGVYDVVLSGQVLEHVRQPWLWMREAARVCRPGGLMLTISPVSWPYHEAPIDCWRIYPEGMRALCGDAGLIVEHCAWESLEPRAWLPRFPRPASDLAPGLLYKVMRAIRWPLQRTYDTVTIARKPAVAAA